MAYHNLSSFIRELEDDRELVRVAAKVDPVFEIAEITRRASSSGEGGPALFFEDVKGSSLPVVTNLLGSRRRLCKALGVASFEQVAERIAGLLRPELPEGLLEGLKLVPQLAHVTKMTPKSVKSGDCQQVVKIGRDVNLRELPIVHSWPQETCPTIAMGQVFTRDPRTGRREIGAHAVEVRDGKSLIVHWGPHDAGYQNYLQHHRAGRQMPLAVGLGGDPLYSYLATAPLPATTDVWLFGGFLRNENIELVKCRSVDLEVPADAEIIIEGTIDTSADLDDAGPLAASTGYYSLPIELPSVTVTALTHRSNPIFPALISGAPDSERYWLSKANERIFLPLVQFLVPEVVDLAFPRAGSARNFLFVSIDKRFPQQAQKAMHALWGLTSLMTTKIMVVVDDDVNVHDDEQVWRMVGANAHPGRDVTFCAGPADLNDHAAPERGMGQKMGIDATRKLPAEGHARPWPDALEMKPEVVELVTKRWAEYGIAKP